MITSQQYSRHRRLTPTSRTVKCGIGLRRCFIRLFPSTHRFVFPVTTFFLGSIFGVFMTHSFSSSSSLPSNPQPDQFSILSSIPNAEIISEDFLYSTPTTTSGLTTKQHSRRRHSKTYAFIFSTGRCGTQHFSLALQPYSRKSTINLPRAFITHEQEDDVLPTRRIIALKYRRIVSSSFNNKSTTTFSKSMYDYIRREKLPFFKRLLSQHNANHLVYTGHIPSAFGLLPTLISILPIGSIRILRLRRERLSTALSLMALGPESQDPWSSSEDQQNINDEKRRWFPIPTDQHVKLYVDQAVWNEQFNRFQKWLWYVDDIECRWHSLRLQYQHRFSFMETSLEQLQVLDGGREWKNTARFLGVDVNFSVVQERHNSIQRKNRTKENIPEHVLRTWDQQYRDVVGPCRLTETQEISWHTSATS